MPVKLLIFVKFASLSCGSLKTLAELQRRVLRESRVLPLIALRMEEAESQEAGGHRGTEGILDPAHGVGST